MHNGEDLHRLISPLLIQAEAFATHLNLPRKREKGWPSTPAIDITAVTPIRPSAPSVMFRVHGTSYYPNRPGRSMALVSEVGSEAGSERWVKEGAALGHFVIHEVRRDGIVYRDGSRLREMAVEHYAGHPRLVRDVLPGEQQVSVAVEGVGIALPAGPNSIGRSGN